MGVRQTNTHTETLLLHMQQQKKPTTTACCDGKFCTCENPDLVPPEDDDDEEDDGMFDDRLMPPALYSKHKKTIWKALCSKADKATPPRVLSPGKGCAFAAARNVRLFIKSAEGGHTPIRGFKMMCMPESSNVKFTFKAVGHIVVRTPEGKLIDPTKHVDDLGTDDYVFVPSSRMHADLTDKQLLSGAYLFNTVLCGDDRIVDNILRVHACVSRFLQRNNVRSPESFPTVPRIHLDELPYIGDWLEASSIPPTSEIDASLAFGARYLIAREEEAEDPALADVCCGTKPLEGLPDDLFHHETNMFLPTTREFLEFHKTYSASKDKLPPAREIKRYLEFYTVMESEYLSRLQKIENKINFEFERRYGLF